MMLRIKTIRMADLLWHVVEPFVLYGTKAPWCSFRDWLIAVAAHPLDC